MIDMASSKRFSKIVLPFILILYFVSRFIFQILFYPLSGDIGNFVVTFYFLVFALLFWYERKNLTNFNIDRVSYLIFGLCGTILRNYQPDLSFLSFVNIGLSSLIVIGLGFAIRYDYADLPKTGNRSLILLGLGLIAGILLVGLIYLPFLSTLIRELTKINDLPALAEIIPWSLYALNYAILTAALPEELFFRGFLWGYLRKLGWKEIWILLFQAGMFWGQHIFLYNENPYLFWIGIPIFGLTMGLLVWRSRSITASIISHGVYNTIISLIKYVLSFGT